MGTAEPCLGGAHVECINSVNSKSARTCAASLFSPDGFFDPPAWLALSAEMARPAHPLFSVGQAGRLPSGPRGGHEVFSISPRCIFSPCMLSGALPRR